MRKTFLLLSVCLALALPALAQYPDITDTSGVSVTIAVPTTINPGVPMQQSGTRWASSSTTVPAGTDFSFGVGSDNLFHCQLSAALKYRKIKISYSA